MAGSIRLVREPDVWQLRVFVGRDANGRVRHRHVHFTGSRRAAERELARLVVEIDQHRIDVREVPLLWGSTTTFNEAIQAWKENGWDDLSPKTTLGYENTWRNHVERDIGRQLIVSTTTYEVEMYFRRLKQSGAGKSTVQQVRALLHRACRLARKWSGGILPNPVSDAELPSWSLAELALPVRSPEPEEVRLLLDAARGEDIRFASMLRVVAATGMRRGEVCALRWSDLIEDELLLIVDESVIAADGGATTKGPKTRASIRRLAIDSDTYDAVVSLFVVQAQLARDCGLELSDSAFMFSFDPGGLEPPHPDALTHAFTRIRTRAGVAKDVHLHSLRHFQATMIDSLISERQKQSRMGWATVHMARHYTDSISAADRIAAEHIGELLRSQA